MLTQLQRHELKAVADFAFKKAGGNLACSTISRIDRVATFSDYVNVEIDNRSVPLDVAIDVDAYNMTRAAGRPWLIEAAAKILGFLLVPAPTGKMAQCDVKALCDISTESAEAIAAFGMARADNVVTPEEARQVRAKIRDAQIAFAALDARLAVVESGDGE